MECYHCYIVVSLLLLKVDDIFFNVVVARACMRRRTSEDPRFGSRDVPGPAHGVSRDVPARPGTPPLGRPGTSLVGRPTRGPGTHEIGTSQDTGVGPIPLGRPGTSWDVPGRQNAVPGRAGTSEQKV